MDFMPIPHRHSIYRLASAVRDIDGNTYLTEAPPFRFVELPDNRRHTVITNETWHDIAARYFPRHPIPELIAKVIADFQPEFVEDMSIALEAGTVIYVPSEATVEDLILNERRRPEFEA